MRKAHWCAILGLAGCLAMASAAHAQTKPYIGFVYPAGGQQGTTFAVKLGGQGLDDIERVLVTGKGVTARITEYHRRIGPQDMQLLSEQLRDLRRASRSPALASVIAPSSTSGEAMMDAMSGPAGGGKNTPPGKNAATLALIEKVERRMREYVQRPACSSISSLVFLEVTIAPGAQPGERELRLAAARGVSNPMVFHVGQLPEHSRKPMLTSHFQVLGKEELALRKRPADEVEERITVPCTVNGQIASGEENRYRFEARRGQRLVISAQARQLVPYIADAVPGWFQPVLRLCDAAGKEVAYDDDYRFKPDPLILWEVPKDGEYVFSITDAIYRGREDFVYRVTIGETPFVTSIFPLGARVGAPATVKLKGWNLPTTELTLSDKNAWSGVRMIAAGKGGVLSNRMPFARDTLPEAFDQEPNNTLARAQKVQLPVIINGHIDKPDDWDVFQFTGHAGDTIVAEVFARRLDSPLDSLLKLTDATGKVLAFNDDHEDAGSGVNTHHADSYLMAKLPADGAYFIHLGDTARSGGEEFAYRLRISLPRPDFALRVVPSSLSMRNKNSGAVSVYVIRKDGFTGTIKLGLKEAPPGISAYTVSLSGTQTVARLGIKADLRQSSGPPQTFNLAVEGRAKVGEREIVRTATPAEDRMQAFLWRHLVPAEDFKVLVFNGSYEPPQKHVPPERPPAAIAVKATSASPTASSTTTPENKPKFTKQQVAGRLRQLKALYEEGLLTNEFYFMKVDECEAVH